MNETLEKRPPPHDFPTVETPHNRVNIRKALAGIHMLNGEGSAYRCLMKAGYSRATARRLNGLSVKDCIDEAAKLDPLMSPAKLLEGGRRRLAESIAFINPQTAPLRDVVRMFEATEKYFGGHEIQPGNATLNLADRLAGIVAFLVVARERGLPVPDLPAQFLEAKVVAESNSDNCATVNTAQAPTDNESATENGSYVNPNW